MTRAHVDRTKTTAEQRMLRSASIPISLILPTNGDAFSQNPGAHFSSSSSPPERGL